MAITDIIEESSMIEAGAPSIKYEGERPLKKQEMLMAGPDWYLKRMQLLMDEYGYDYDEAGEIAYDSDKYYEVIGIDPGGMGDESRNMDEEVVEEEGIMRAANGGMAIQSGVKNYEPSQMVSVPKEFRARKNSPNTHLAYITDDEAGILKALKPDTPHKGPRGIPNYDSFDAAGGYSNPDTGYSASSGGAGGGWQDSSRQDKEINKRWEQSNNQQKQQWNAQQEQIKLKQQQEQLQKQIAQQQQTQKVMDRRKKMGAKYVDQYISLDDPYGEKDDTEAMMDLFVNDPYREDGTQRSFLPTPVGMGLKLFEGPLKAGAKKTREFFSGPTKDIFGRDQKGVLAAGKFNYKGGPLTAERFSEMSLTEKNKAYKDYMSQRMSGQIDAYGNLAPGLRREQIKHRNADGTYTMREVIMGEKGGGGRDNYILPISSGGSGGGGSEEEVVEEEWEMPLAFRAEGGRVGKAYGGIMDKYTGRRAYGLGSIFKKVKKVFKSPLGKAALIGLGGWGLSKAGLFGSGGLGGVLSGIKSKGLGKYLSGISPGKIAAGIGGISLATALLTPPVDEDNDGYDDKTGFSVEEWRKKGAQGSRDVPLAFRAEGGDAESGLMMASAPDPMDERNSMMENLAREYFGKPLRLLNEEEIIQIEEMMDEMDPYGSKPMARPDRVMAQEGGLMDLGGMEKDYREDGGFVPIGGKEKADDVPARLSKNEFVFTADAVRNAGGGDVDKGAEVMYNVMKNLEAGGEVSEETQGLDGARQMFQTSQRLEEVL